MSDPSPPAPSLVGQVVSGRYRIERLLGEGGMGAVYLAEHTHMRKRVALKLLHAEMSSDKEVLARFRREAEAAAHVEHPNVASATDFGQTEDGSFFLVLEYVEGKSLRAALDEGPLLPARALHIGRQIASALERAHTSGIVHRDLKPENVMLVDKAGDPDFVKVLDFGIAKVEPHPTRDVSQPLTKLGTILGTPEYMAPEQALGEAVGPAADLYAVGVMLYEMLTGKHPFDAPDRMAVLSMHIVAPVPAMADRNPALDVPAPVEAVVRRLLDKDAKARHPSARALAEAIDDAAMQSGLELPAGLRPFARESNPGAPPTSTREVAPPSTRNWVPQDALAKTDYGIPTPQFSVPAKPPADRRRLYAAVAGGVVLLLLVLVVALTRTGTKDVTGRLDGGALDDAAAPARRTQATPEEIRSAAGSTGLAELSAKYPEDPAVQHALAVSLAEAGKAAEALAAIRAFLRLKGAPDDALVQIALAAASKPDTAEDAFALLEGPLGPGGVDALVELSTTKSVPASIRTRATKSLARSEVRAAASPATSVMLDLKSAMTCTAKHDLLERVKESGDARVLGPLKQLKAARGCGFMGMRDCWPCLRRDDALDEAIRAVEARK